MTQQLQTPVVFIIFNRPQTTLKVFEAIRQAKPQKLLIIADAPRSHKADDHEKCLAARAIVENVDWECDISYNYSENNLGCAKRIETGLDWVFELVEEAIILEDDCLPEHSFFRFCEELLDRYRDDERVMHVGGHNRLYCWKPGHQSYHFSYIYGSPHGWATWRRAWSAYNQPTKAWNDQEIICYLKKVLEDPQPLQQFLSLCEKIFTHPNYLDEWGYKWTFVKLARGGLSAIPGVNMVNHIGSGSDATHIKHKTALNGTSIPRDAINFPLQAPPQVEVDLEFEREHGYWSMGKPHVEYLLPLIEKLMTTGNNINALVLIENGLIQQPESATLHYLKAKTLLSLRQPKRAILALEKAITIDPTSLAPKNLLNQLQQA